MGQAAWLKQDVPLFLASIWNSVSSRAGLWLLSLANGECAQADKAEGICSTFHEPFKQHSGSQNARLWERWLKCQSHYGPEQLHLSRNQLSSIWRQSNTAVMWFNARQAPQTGCLQSFVSASPTCLFLLCENDFNTITVTCTLCTVVSVRFPAVCLALRCQL